MRYHEINESARDRTYEVLVQYDDPSGKGIASRTFKVSAVTDADDARRVFALRTMPKLKNGRIVRVKDVTPEPVYEDLHDKVQDVLASSILDILTPIAANGIQSVTVQQLIGKVQKIPTGLKIDRELIMQVLDPNKFPMVKSIEGDNIYLQVPQTIRSVNDKQKDSEAQHIKTTAVKQAQQAVKNDAL